MNRYVMRRLIMTVPTLLGISLVVFAILSLAPGDPLSQFANNPAVPPDVALNLRRSLGLDRPWPVRYVKWLISLVTKGDLGFSFASRIPVTDLILQRLPTSIWVFGISYLTSILIAIPIGVIAAVKQYSIFDHLVSTLAYIGFSLPTFFGAMILILIFGVKLQWFPWIYDSTLGATDLHSFLKLVRQSVLPITVLSLFQTGSLTRYTRASMLENLSSEYVCTARAKGLAERTVILRHVLRNSLISVVTVVALGIPSIFTGSVITEQIFRMPGIGALLITSFETSDTPVIMAITFIYAILMVVFNLIADIVYTIVDPRVKYS